MSAKKFERLIDLIINEDQEKAEQLFHDIVVEKSREIYESLINEDQSMGLLDEIESENAGMEGMMEDEESFEADEEISGDFDVEGEEDEEAEFDDEEEFDDEDEEEFDDEDEEAPATKGDILDLEDKLDDLIAQFEAEMGSDTDVESMDENLIVYPTTPTPESEEPPEGSLSEAVELKKVSVSHGDNGAQTKSPGLSNPKRVDTGAAPVKFAAGSESVPTSPKAPSNYATKGEGKLSASAKNVDGAYAFKEKGEAAPKPKTETIKAKSPVAESRTAKRRI